MISVITLITEYPSDFTSVYYPALFQFSTAKATMDFETSLCYFVSKILYMAALTNHIRENT